MPSYKFPNIPGTKAYKEETADFWEIQAICNPQIFISQLQISKTLGIELDELNHDGIESEEDLLNNRLDDVFKELQKRAQFTSNRYPFNFNRYAIKVDDAGNLYRDVYLFLLLCTRFNMKTEKVKNNIDGTLVFEKLCAHVAKNYFGSNSNSFVFGTAEPGSFETKVKAMIRKIGEGVAFKNPNSNPPTKNDDSVDVVVWKEFSDKRIGKLIGFGQCKTGTSWKDDIKKLNPDHFCKKWFYESPIVTPLSLVFICDTMNEDFNFYDVQLGYLIFNRFRILEYINDDLDDSIKHDIQNWIEGALESLN